MAVGWARDEKKLRQDEVAKTLWGSKYGPHLSSTSLVKVVKVVLPIK